MNERGKIDLDYFLYEISVGNTISRDYVINGDYDQRITFNTKALQLTNSSSPT
ncbi:hypothetical protein [Flavobacterium cheongpyeongense]|jgi:hypothetical protein|uniref:hypothetical protein n=1 Tax=Flavobacterium cheongpyeongense TaxID=2212651 RepID=UPI001403BDFF|nr:hypothetical protein [Flavobacterium cheongpyeongense]